MLIQLEYTDKFADGPAGTPSIIFDLLYTQDKRSKAEYISQISLQLEGIDTVSVSEAKIAFMSIDPGINANIINQYIKVNNSSMGIFIKNETLYFGL